MGGGGGVVQSCIRNMGIKELKTPQNCEDSSVVGLVWVPDYCERCNVPKNAQLAHSFMGHLLASRPNKILAIDFTVLEASRSGIENVLVMTDVFTKYSLAFPTRDQRAEIVVGVLVTEWFYKLGIAGRIHSDEGRNFKSRMMQHLCDLYAIRKSRTTSYHPAGNGQCEQFLTAPFIISCVSSRFPGRGTGCRASLKCCFIITLLLTRLPVNPHIS